VSPSFFIAGTAKSTLPVWLQFQELADYLINQGFEMKTTFPARNFISINHSERDYSNYLKTGGSPTRAVLILLEPQAVYPSQYKQRILRKYSLVLRPGNPSYNNPDGKFIAWPYESNPNPLTPSTQKVSLKDLIASNLNEGLFDFELWQIRGQYLAIINSNKVSAAPIENYSLRRLFAHDINPELLAVYGDLWDGKIWRKIRHRLEVLFLSIISRCMPNLRNVYGNLHWVYPSSRGVIGDKQELLKNIKFNIVIENDPNYISEKLFDSMINGCIPIYSGPDVSNEIIPAGSYIKLPAIPGQLLNVLEALTDLDLKNILTQIKDFVSSNAFLSVWEKESVFTHIGKEVSLHFGVKNE
jgi:hypothetical protein